MSCPGIVFLEECPRCVMQKWGTSTKNSSSRDIFIEGHFQKGYSQVHPALSGSSTQNLFFKIFVLTPLRRQDLQSVPEIKWTASLKRIVF